MITILDKGDNIKVLETLGGSDVRDITYYKKEGLYQTVNNDVWYLYYDILDPKVTLSNPSDFKDFNGGVYDSWDELTDYIQTMFDGVTATNGLDVSSATTLSSTNISSTSINVVYATTGSAYTLDLDSTLGVGTIINIKDISGTSKTNNLTISGSAQTIDGASSLVINTASSSYTIVKKSSTEWYIISGLV